MSADELLQLIKKGWQRGKFIAKFPKDEDWASLFAWERPTELAKLRKDLRERWEKTVITECIDQESGNQYFHPAVPVITGEQ